MWKWKTARADKEIIEPIITFSTEDDIIDDVILTVHVLPCGYIALNREDGHDRYFSSPEELLEWVNNEYGPVTHLRLKWPTEDNCLSNIMTCREDIVPIKEAKKLLLTWQRQLLDKMLSQSKFLEPA